jgi:hypothetical protein
MRTAPLRLACWALLAGLLSAGCEQLIGADFSEPTEIREKDAQTGTFEPPEPDFKDADAFCAAFAAALCTQDVQDACWGQEDCKQATQQACAQRMGSRRGYQSEDALDCIRATTSFGKSLSLSSSDRYNRIVDCRKAFGQHAQLDEPCFADYDCAPGTSSSSTPQCIVKGPGQRVCQVPEGTRQLEQSCSGWLCSGGLYCNENTEATPVCEKKLAGTEQNPSPTCSSLDACGYDATNTNQYFCLENPQNPRQSSCQRLLASGDPCSQDRQCGLYAFCVGGVCASSLTLPSGPEKAPCQALRANPLIGAL